MPATASHAPNAGSTPRSRKDKERPAALHSEMPWQLARMGCADNIPSNELISIESIRTYYIEKNANYDFSCEAGLRRYILDVLS